MNKMLLILMGIAIIVSGSVILLYSTPSEIEPTPVYDTGFTYYDIEKIQKTLAAKNIFVSTPTAITDHTINQYCTFFEKGLPENCRVLYYHCYY